MDSQQAAWTFSSLWDGPGNREQWQLPPARLLELATITKFNLHSWQFHKRNHVRRGSSTSVQSQSIRMLSSAKTPPAVGSTQENTELLCDGRGEAPHSHWRRLPRKLRIFPLDMTRWAGTASSGVPQACSSIACTQGMPIASSSPEFPEGTARRSWS